MMRMVFGCEFRVASFKLERAFRYSQFALRQYAAVILSAALALGQVFRDLRFAVPQLET
jgi:hypothetical protein